MTSSSLTDPRGIVLRSLGVGGLLVATLTCALLSGCIADTADDSDLPWASNRNWEGIAPIAPTVMDRYD